ncbi:MAG: phosphotransferase family protein [Acidobacteriota bacterium]
MDQWLDSSRPIRQGEALDLEKLEPYLRQHLPEMGEPLEIEQFPSGFSNLTYLLRAGDLELVLRRPPFGNRVKSAHDMGREYRVLEGLHPVYPQAPKPYVYCDDEAVLGAPFYVMERRRGVILRRELPDGLELSPVMAERLCESFIDNLATLHNLDYKAAGLGDLGKPQGYVERQIGGWTKRYQNVQTDSWTELDQTAAWLHAHMPDETGAALVHNDYKYDNLLLNPDDLTQITGVLDWEMCTIGDPLMDLGTTLAYWTEANDDPRWRAVSFGPTTLPGSLTRQQVADRYRQQTGLDTSNLTFYFCFGLFKLAVIGQQIYYRFFKGHTRDPRFANLNQMVGLLGQVATQAIERDKI